MRKNLYYILLIFLISTFTLRAQCIQKIRFMEYVGEGAKKPLANVEVVVGNAGSAVSDKNGYCTLRFRTLKAGDKVTVRRISKPGYEVLNLDLLDQWIVARDEDSGFVIVMTSSKRMEEEHNKYQHTAERMVAKSMMQEQTAIGKLFNENKITKEEYEKKIEQLRIEYNRQLDDIENFIDRIVHTDINEIAESEKAILKHVMEGDISGAISEYQKINIIGSYKAQVEERRQLESAAEKIGQAMLTRDDNRKMLYESMKRQNDLLILKGGEANIDAGFKLWREFAFADTTFFLPLYEYAVYCERSDRISEALEALEYCRHATDTVSILRTDLLHAEVLFRKGKYRQATEDLERAYHHMDSISISRKDNMLFLYERAEALIYLCQCYTSLMDVERGRAIRQKVIETNGALYNLDRKNPTYKRNYVNSLYVAHRSVYNLDYRKLSADDEENKEALKVSRYLDEAIALQEELYKADPVKQSGMLASLHETRASMKRIFADDIKDSAQFATVEPEYLRSIELYDEAYAHNPRAYAHKLAVAYFNYGGLYIAAGNYEDSEKVIGLLEKAKEYENRYIEYNPDTNRRSYATILYGIGAAYYGLGDYILAEQPLLEAADAIMPYYLETPKRDWKILDDIYCNLLDVYSPEALDEPEKMAEIARQREDIAAKIKVDNE